MAPLLAYPKGYKLGPDNQGWLMGLKNKIQVLFTGGPRVTPTSSFWHWRDMPKTLVVLSGNGDLRYENTDGSKVIGFPKKPYTDIWPDDETKTFDQYYLSRIQCWKRWHIALMYPLGIHWSFIYRSKDVVKYPKYQSVFGIKKMWCGYLGWIRDADKVYKPKAYPFGGNFE